ncbi:MAG: ATP synthase F1 subunit epsilon [Deltaproteobacteria bacterium]|nr:ATP synthase F1 subunit epsilon [Deltaproteobacteria bacterium]
MSLELVVVTPQGEAFAEAANQVVLPGTEGDFGVLEEHEKFLCPLQPGIMEIHLPDGKVEWAAISDGFAEVTAKQVVVLVDECFKAHEIDLEHAEHSRAEAEQELADILISIDTQEHRDRLENAIVRLSVQIDAASRPR